MRAPDLAEKEGQHQQGYDAADDIDQCGVHEIRPEELDAAEGDAADQQAGPDREGLPGGAEYAHQPEGQHQGGDGQDAADHGAEIRLRQAGDGDQGAHGIAQPAVGHRGGVGDEAEHGGLERRETEPDHHGAGDRDGSAASARAFEQCAEGEGDQQHLQAAVFGDIADRLLDDGELAGIYGDVIDEDRGHYDPGDAKPAEDQAIGDRTGDHDGGHAEDGQRDGYGGDEGIDGGPPCGSAAHGQEEEERADRNGRGQGGEPGIAKGVEVLQPGFIHFCGTLAKVTQTGAPTSRMSPVGVKPPVFWSMRKTTMLSESWLAAKRNAPVGSMAKLRGILP